MEACQPEITKLLAQLIGKGDVAVNLNENNIYQN